MKFHVRALNPIGKPGDGGAETETSVEIHGIVLNSAGSIRVIIKRICNHASRQLDFKMCKKSVAGAPSLLKRDSIAVVFWSDLSGTTEIAEQCCIVQSASI